MSPDEVRSTVEFLQSMSLRQLFMHIVNLGQATEKLPRMVDGSEKDYMTDLALKRTWEQLNLCEKELIRRMGKS